ncbi:hypothetical protein [Nostoc linckia]|uniref:hypothetical protein n=1 Tax=Nostoc linckia TaxID=92942 RepID=UPI001180BDE5|nr:hypothetical protein [Nostoc linckia]
MKRKDATTQNPRGRRKNRQRKNESTGLGEHGKNSPVYGTNQVRTPSLNSSGKDTTWADRWRNPTPGKILKRLELIEKAFSSYVQADKYRLETRLEEVKNAENLFKEEIKALKQEIYRLDSDSIEEAS